MISTGKETLKSKTAAVAMATAAQTGTSIENSSKVATPPAKSEAAIKGLRQAERAAARRCLASLYREVGSGPLSRACTFS